MAKKQKPKTARESIAAILSNRYNFRMIVEAVADKGIKVTISHLSRINSGEREASEGLTAALAELAGEWGK